ncbi:Sulfhydryl oxidase 1 [Acorus calamus]|uniref:Sulfhydryl oxidase n=1 Tax=Acorus calamus TaxID=4465 RepID=A0AAV9DDB2_ACOCL|nr:Sulfhydryl oxidase 1 [Acorus calamus]
MLLLLLLFLLSPAVSTGSAAASFVGSRRAILRSLGDGGPDHPDVVVDLNSSNFDRVLSASPASFAVVEFFAHWCPACRNYKPHYEKVARLFNGPDAVHPGNVFMTRVDCAEKMNTKLCDRFSISYFPMLFWGPPSKFASGRWVPKQENNEIQNIDDGRTAERLLNWINKKLGSSFSFDDEKYENENVAQSNDSDVGQVARAIYDVEEVTANAFDIILDHKMIKSETRAPLIKFFQLLVAHHPSKRCRQGTAEILVNFDELWPSGVLSNNSEFTIISQDKDPRKSFQICGKEVPRGYWIFCRGSRNDTRGFSCGLWVLLHSLSVRVSDGESHTAFVVICDFIHNFFVCDDCRRHFYEMCSRVSNPMNTTREFALWVWSTHNSVNERLMREENDLGNGDPKFPKMIWPSRHLCPSCYLSQSKKINGTIQINWRREEVFNFLVNYYGKTLASSFRDTIIHDSGVGDSMIDDLVSSANAVAVPIGAALAIAVASCSFGALACFWRTKQKNRKYSHHLYPLKNV